jgi:hypothetical protein
LAKDRRKACLIAATLSGGQEPAIMSMRHVNASSLTNPTDPDVMYCGVEPAALYQSRDDGETWSLVRGLFEHEASSAGGLRYGSV